ncbi:hypothetical protein PI125_g13683 [Phytophthora idaei]|nr:hypothetical protein PI125_g13683 [Phytophthora idaei]
MGGWSANAQFVNPPTPATARNASLSMSAIPSYRGVTIGVTPRTPGYGVGALPPSTLYPPFQPPMVTTPRPAAWDGNALNWAPAVACVAMSPRRLL